ncbi:MAG: phage major capsid protein, partial [Gammaproteobacteria bacterium]|nr:phage major capsid protein [Gammaproteobacteria bacterium]
MLESQRLAIRSSEIREKLNELSGEETLTEEQRSEVDTLTTEYRDVEAKRRAAIVAEDAEEREAAKADGQ